MPSGSVLLKKSRNFHKEKVEQDISIFLYTMLQPPYCICWY